MTKNGTSPRSRERSKSQWCTDCTQKAGLTRRFDSTRFEPHLLNECCERGMAKESEMAWEMISSQSRALKSSASSPPTSGVSMIK